MRVCPALLPLAAVSLASPVAAQPAAPPLRTLVYAVTVSETSTSEEHTSGFRSRGAIPIGSATVQRIAHASDEGTFTLRILAAIADRGLVVEAAFSGRNSEQPPVLIALRPDGTFRYEQHGTLSAVTMQLVPLFARGLAADHDVSPGASWTTPVEAPARGSITYRVGHVDGEDASLSIVSDITVPGPQGYVDHADATALYDTRLLCPLRYEADSQSRHVAAGGEQEVRTSGRITATLTSDSFAKAGTG